MREWLGPVIGSIAGLCGIVAVCVLIASCAQDYAKATPQVVEVLILDKNYSPAHDDTSCSTDSEGRMSCSTTHYEPSWSVEYADETRHYTSVSQGTYDLIRIGERKKLRFDLGGGYWHARYNERFQFGQMVAESMPTR